MTTLLGYDNLPPAVLAQLERVTAVWKAQLGSRLVGVYLHGSIALRAFCPDSGDLDLLVVVKNALTVPEKLALAREIIRLDGQPCPLELSALTRAEAAGWKTPGCCQFHYSDFWTERYLARFQDPSVPLYVVDQPFPDADVTSYIRLLHQCGVVLYGPPAADVFAPVSDEDFWAAISADVDEYDFHSYNPRYLGSNVLILGRILSFKEEKRILSKYEAGLWAAEHVPADLAYLLRRAMEIWFEGGQQTLPEADLERLRCYLVAQIRA